MRNSSLLFRLSIAMAAIVLLSSSAVLAESDLEKVIRQQNENNVKGYMQPIVDLFGADMNSGFNHSAFIPTSGLHFRFDLIGMGALVQDDQKSFEAVSPADANVKFKTATVFGEKGGTTPNPLDPANPLRGSDGLFSKATILPFAAPQITIGHVYGTEAIIRFVPIPEIGEGDFPKTTLFGLGIRHSLSQYIEEAPLDIAVGGMYNSLTIGDLVSLKGFLMSLQASKQFSILIVYGSLQYEKSTLTLSFKTTDPLVTNKDINIDLEGSNVVRGTLGVALNLSVLKLFADMNFGAVTNFSGGIGFGF